MIIKYFFLNLVLSVYLFSKSFTLASYNVENLFDLKYDKSEYKEYIPFTSSKWNSLNYRTKLDNIAQTIKDLNADIIVLQEIESQSSSNDLFKYFEKYRYKYFYKSKNQAIGLSIFSKFKIIKNETIDIKYAKFNRAIVKSTIKINNKLFVIYNNHWPSKRNKESLRIEYALALYKHIENTQKGIDYVLIGDFNANYNENETFLYNKKLNNTSNLTSINDVLYTYYNNSFISKHNILDHKQRVHYNPWLELDYNDRFSYIYKGENNTPDNILLSASLFDGKNISYINNSFKVFKKDYLIQNRKINRWKMKNRIHRNAGYSDHLPIIARFSIKKYQKEPLAVQDIKNIRDIYKYTTYKYPLRLNNLTVIYKTKNIVILKKENDRAIVVYRDIQNLKLGFTYDILINKIKRYNGLEEIRKISTLKRKKFNTNYKELFLNAKGVNILDTDYKNEVITNLKGVYKKNYLHFDNQKIRIYSKNKAFLPINGTNLNIINAHLAFYKSKMQIIIHKRSDINVN